MDSNKEWDSISQKKIYCFTKLAKRTGIHKKETLQVSNKEYSVSQRVDWKKLFYRVHFTAGMSYKVGTTK